MVEVMVNWSLQMRTVGDGLKAATAGLNHQAVTGWRSRPEGWRCHSAADHLPRIHEALDSIQRTEEKKRREERGEETGKPRRNSFSFGLIFGDRVSLYRP